jgi:hypothetical protein
MFRDLEAQERVDRLQRLRVGRRDPHARSFRQLLILPRDRRRAIVHHRDAVRLAIVHELRLLKVTLRERCGNFFQVRADRVRRCCIRGIGCAQFDGAAVVVKAERVTAGLVRKAERVVAMIDCVAVRRFSGGVSLLRHVLRVHRA